MDTVGDEKRSKLKRFFLGGVAGMFSSICLQPLDVIKTRMQGNVFIEKKEKVKMRAIFQQLVKENGLRSLWRGSLPTAIRSALGPGIYFAVLEQMNAIDSPQDALIKGAFGRSIAGIIVNPITVLKTRFEWSSTSNPNLLSTLLNLARNEGLKGLFAGVGPTLARDVPQAAIYLELYQRFKKTDEIQRFPFATSISSFLAAVISTTFTIPFDVFKTGQQLKSSHRLSFQEIIQRNGVSVLFSGMSTRLVRKPLQMSLTWTLYEMFR